MICLGIWGIFTQTNRNPLQFSSSNNMSNNADAQPATESITTEAIAPIKVNPPADDVYPDYEKEILTMINFVGMTIEDAKTELANIDETIEVTITEKYSSDVATGLVISQSIAEDTQFTYGNIKQIQLVVSKGPMPTTQAPKSMSSDGSGGNNINSGKANTQNDEDGYTTIHLE